MAKKSVYDLMEENNSYQKTKDFMHKQQWPYSLKKAYAEKVAWAFYEHPDISGNAYVAVGGLDSITLFVFLRSIGINVPAVSASSLEDKSIQVVHKALGVIGLTAVKDENGKPYTKMRVIQQFGYPVISKEVAQKIQHIQNPTEKNATVRHAIMTGETGAYGGYQKNSRMKLANKWLQKFGGPENEKEGTDYDTADIKVSDRCCYYLKERPCDDYAKESGRSPYMGLMASEGGRRQKALMWHGCNYVSKSTKRSCPFAIFSRQDLLRLALEMDAWYQEHWQEFSENKVESIIPTIYGDIEKTELTGDEKAFVYDKVKLIMNSTDTSGNYPNYSEAELLDDLLFPRLRTTKAQRTGCSMCGFGVHIEKRPHRFDLLWQRNPKEWDLWMHHIEQDANGEWTGWDKVLDYIGVEWRNPEQFFGGDKK